MPYTIRPKAPPAPVTGLLTPWRATLVGSLIAGSGYTDSLLRGSGGEALGVTLGLIGLAGCMTLPGALSAWSRRVRQQWERLDFMPIIERLPVDWRVMGAEVIREAGDPGVAALYLVTPEQHCFLLVSRPTGAPLVADEERGHILGTRGAVFLNPARDIVTFPKHARSTRTVVLDLWHGGPAAHLGHWTLSPGAALTQAQRLVRWTIAPPGDHAAVH